MLTVLSKKTDGSYGWTDTTIPTDANNLKTIKYTVGVFNVPDCDYNFTSVANANEQSIQLGTTIIPANSPITWIVAVCQDGLNGAATATSDMGTSSGANNIWDAANLDDTNDLASNSGFAPLNPSAAISLYFSIDPNTNWNLLTSGKWKIWISYIDNSTL